MVGRLAPKALSGIRKVAAEQCVSLNRLASAKLAGK